MKVLYKRSNKTYEQGVELTLAISALIASVVVVLITAFVFATGLPLIQKVGLANFVFGREWYPEDGVFGIFPMILGSIYVTIGALLLGVPLGLAGAIFLAEFAPPVIVKVIRPAVELLAGIPSVVYGFYGLVIIVPFFMKHVGGTGFSIVSGSLILAIMILPTIINIAEDAIRAVPKEYKEGYLALGATHWETVKNIMVPAARSGIIAGVVLGMGRAVGETMAVIMVTGNVTAMPDSIFSPVRTLTGNVVIEMGYAVGDHQQALFATGVVLFVMIMILNIIANMSAKGRVGR